jgi:hypothetical protein
MKRIISFLIVSCFLTLTCSSAWADIILDGTWGDVGGYLSNDDPQNLVATDYRTVGEIDNSPVSGSLSYDLLNNDTIDDTFAGTEVGLWYANGYVVLPDPLRTIETGADGTAFFMVNSEQFSLDWDFQKGGTSPYDFGYGWINLSNWSDGTNLLYEYFSPDEPGGWSGTETFTLDPIDLYRLDWHLEIDITGAGWGTSDVWAQLNIGVPTVVPAPAAVILCILGLGTAGIKLRKKTKQ